ncbi:MAG: TldD/PmbA family protein [Thermoleophilia bacterium]
MRPLLTRETALDWVEDAVGTALSAGADEAEALLLTEASALTRFARSRIHQNVGEANVELRVRAVRGRRVAVVSTNRLHRETVAEAAERAVRMARHSREDLAFAGLPSSSFPYVDQTTYYEATAAVGPPDRAQAVADVLQVLQEGGARGYGVITNGVTELAVRNSRGIHAYQAFTDAFVSVIAERLETARETAPDQAAPGVTGYWAAASRDSVQLDPHRAAVEALTRARPLPQADIAPGRYTVLLEEEAVADLIAFFGHLALNGLAYVEGRCLFSGALGEERYPGHITLRDDPTDVRTANASFDFEGVAKAPFTMIREGRVENVAFDHQTAARAGLTGTGHALPAPNTHGPVPLNLVLTPGSRTREELIRGVERGLLITRFHYVNAVDPSRTLLTGMTRDGTFLIEDGRITARAPDLRWVDSVDEILRRSIAVGSPGRLISEGPGYGMRHLAGVLAAPLLTADFQITGTV